MKSNEKLIYKKDNEIYVKLMFGDEKLNTLTGKGDDLDNVLWEHPNLYARVSLKKDSLEYEEDILSVELEEIKHLKEEKFMEVSQQIRENYNDNKRLTDSFVKERASINSEVLKLQEDYFKKKKEKILVKKFKNFMITLTNMMNHKKDCLVSLSANFRSEMSNDVSNLEKKANKIMKGQNNE